MPRVLRRKKRAAIDGRILTFREALSIRVTPEGFYPDWAVAQVEARLDRYAPRFVPGAAPPKRYKAGEELRAFRARRDAFLGANAERQAEYEAYLEGGDKPEWFTGERDFIV